MYMGLIRKTRRTVDLDPLVHDHLGDMFIFGAHYWAGRGPSRFGADAIVRKLHQNFRPYMEV